MELKELVEKANEAIKEARSAIDTYKKDNDKRLEALEKGGPTSEIKERMGKIDVVLEKMDKKQQELELALKSKAAADKEMDEEAELAAVSAKYKKTVSKDFLKFVRKGMSGGKGDDFSERIKEILASDEFKEQKSLSVQNDPDGGYFVHPDMSGRIIKRMFERSPVRSVAGVQAISTDALEGPVDWDDTEFQAVTEKNPTTNRTTPRIGMWRIPVHEKATAPLITQKLLEDAAVDVEAWLAQKIADKRARQEGYDFLWGNGVDAPMGMLVKAAGTNYNQVENIASIANNAISGNDLLNLQMALKSWHRANARYAMHRLTFRAIRKLKDAEGRYLWEPSWTAGMPSQLLGLPTIEFDDMATVTSTADAFATSSLPIVCADFTEFYQIVDRIGLSVLRDPFSNKPFVEFYTRYRVGGDVHNGEAGKRLIVSG